MHLTDNANDVAEHLRQMQKKYGFVNDADSVRDAIEEFAELLNADLTEEEIVAACHYVLASSNDSAASPGMGH